MLSLTAADIEARPYAGFPAWPVAGPEIGRFIPGVLADLGLGGQLPGDADSDAAVAARHYRALQSFGPGFSVRLSAWLPFKTRNFAHAFRGILDDDVRARVWLNSNVVAIEAIPGFGGWEVQRIHARTPSGRRLQASARFFVLAAGALETTRLLLHYDESTQGSLVGAGVPLGRHFSDHLSVTCGRFRCHDWRVFNLGVAPVFIRGVMRTPRLELSPATQESLHLSSAYAHFTFITRGDTGFDVVRNLLRTRQGERRELGLSPARIGRVVGDVSQMCWWRYARRRLWIPRRADVLLQVDVEQRPNPDSRIVLDESRDALGLRRLIIDWRITAEETRAVRETTRLAAAAWRNCALGSTATLELADEANSDDFTALYDVYHPTGALRMGASANQSVVNPDLRVWHSRNLYLSTTGVFPSAGSANPGLMHLALTARLADHLVAATAKAS
jgi:choline dehydrogenase-like flavoprotein